MKDIYHLFHFSEKTQKYPQKFFILVIKMRGGGDRNMSA